MKYFKFWPINKTYRLLKENGVMYVYNNGVEEKEKEETVFYLDFVRTVAKRKITRCKG